MANIDMLLRQDSRITLYCNENSAFSRNFLALVKHWDRSGKIDIKSSSESQLEAASNFQSGSQAALAAVDENGVQWNGAEAVPIVFKNLPFGRLAAAMYILPGTMWVTKQLYAMDSARYHSL